MKHQEGRVVSRTSSWSIRLLALVGTTLLLVSCGGASQTSDTTPPPSGTISGTVSKGPVSGAAVNAFSVSGGTIGAQIGSGTTDSQGNFTVMIGSYSGPVMLRMTGGTYTDEATNTSMAMMAGDVMTAVVPSVPAGSATSGVQVTPLTSMAQMRALSMSGGMTDANIGTANAEVGSYFSVSDILHVMPMNPLVAGSASTATQDQKNYGMTLAAMSQYADGIGMMTSSSGIVTAMMDDASDGVMDGRMGGTSIPMGGGMMGGSLMQATAGTTGLATAMSQFIGSATNKCGVTLTDMQALMDKLNASNGQLQGGTVVGSISGTATFGPMSGATMMAFAIGTDGTMGAQIGSGTTDRQGNFTVAIGSHSGPVMLRMSGGTYTDEATNTTMGMMAGDVMTAVVPPVTAGSATIGIQVTPLTSMAQMRALGMSGGMTDANIGAANAEVSTYFSVSGILHVTPMNPLVTGSATTATQDEKNYGMTLAAMSQYADGIGMMTSSSGIVTAMMDDASDGVMDGKMGGASISLTGMDGMMGGTTMQATAGTTGLATAMSQFIGSAMNKSGVTVTDMQALMDKLSGSSGAI